MLFYLWGHSYEFDEKHNNNWEVIRAFAAYIGKRDEIFYATNGGVRCNYGLLRGAVVCMLLYVMATYLLTMFIPETSGIFKMINDSELIAFVDGLSFLNVDKILTAIIGG